MQKKLSEPLTDQYLFNAIKRGSKPAFSYVYDKYAPALFAVINSITNNNTLLSEEILQGSFCAIWQNIKNYNPAKQRFFTWILCISRQLALESVYPRRHEIQKGDTVVNDINEVSEIRSSDSINALELVYFNGKSIEEAAKKLDICADDLKISLRKHLHPFRDINIHERYKRIHQEWNY